MLMRGQIVRSTIPPVHLRLNVDLDVGSYRKYSLIVQQMEEARIAANGGQKGPKSAWITLSSVTRNIVGSWVGRVA